MRRTSLLFVVCLAAMGCEQKNEKPQAKAASSADGTAAKLAAKRASWKKFWERGGELKECATAAPAAKDACASARAARAKLKAAELADAKPDEHLKAAVEAARLAQEAGAKLNTLYQADILDSAPPIKKVDGGLVREKPDGGKHAGHGHEGHGHEGHGHEEHAEHDDGDEGEHDDAKPASSAEVAKELKKGKSRGEGHPIQLLAGSYLLAERQALTRVVAYVNYSSGTLKQQAFDALALHAKNFPKSLYARQILNEAILFERDAQWRKKLREVREAMGPGTIPTKR